MDLKKEEIYAVIVNSRDELTLVRIMGADKHELFSPRCFQFSYDDCVLVRKQGEDQVRVLEDYELDELRENNHE